MILIHFAPAFSAAFLASLVECVEALTVVLAVGAARGWRPAVSGSGAALLVLLLIVALPGRWLLRVPIEVLQLVIGALLLAFGMRWLRKATLRACGVLARRNEAAIYAQRLHALSSVQTSHQGNDREAFLTTFKVTLLEGCEVVFIVLAVGSEAGRTLRIASLGALAALAVVIALGASIHRPLTRIPENALKFVVGLLLTAFGCFWVGQGLGVAWPGGDWAILMLTVLLLLVSMACVRLCRRHARGAPT